MWRNYWTVAVRALAKSRTYSIINIAGLAIGMAACIIILLYIRYEQNYDRWLPDVDNTYQLQSWYAHPDDGEPFFLQMSSYVTGPRLKKDFPQVEATSYILGSEPVFYKDGQASMTEDYKVADSDFLKVVNLPLVAGTTLTAPQTAVVTREEAIKRYGTDQVVGRTLTVISKGQKRDFKITGVLQNLPKNSSMKINAILRMDFNSFFATEPFFLTCWSCQSGWVYVKLKPGTDAQQIQAQMAAWEKRNIPDEYNGDIKRNAGDQQDWHLVNLKDVHLGKAQDGAMTPSNDERTITTFAIIAMLILGMAVVNFTNLATARASQRAREVALRKVLGATRRQLIVQFVAESILISSIAMLLALALVFAICAALLGYAFYSQLHDGLEPCPLCIFQRVAFFALGVAFLIGGLHAPKSIGGRRGYGVLALLAAVAGIAVAGNHVRLQHLPPDQVPACGPGLDYMLDAMPISGVIRKVRVWLTTGVKQRGPERSEGLVCCRVAPGDRSPGAPTDPDMRISRIRLVTSWLRDP